MLKEAKVPSGSLIADIVACNDRASERATCNVPRVLWLALNYLPGSFLYMKVSWSLTVWQLFVRTH